MGKTDFENNYESMVANYRREIRWIKLKERMTTFFVGVFLLFASWNMGQASCSGGTHHEFTNTAAIQSSTLSYFRVVGREKISHL